MGNKLIDFMQGMSNAAASNVSAPVDGLAWLMRKAGVNVGEAPLGGSNWMRAKGLTPEPQNRLAGILGESLGGVAPMLAAARAPQIARGLLQAGENMAAPRTLNPQTGAIVWHGSPHKFDKFDAGKIGTGEGNQAYGHGLYVAEQPLVAAEYQKNLATEVTYKGKPFITGAEGNRVASTGNALLDDYITANMGDLSAARKGLLTDTKELRPFNTEATKEYQQAMADLRGVRPEMRTTNSGSLYKVDLPDEHIAKMLDWDKPLSQQSPEIQKAIQAASADMSGTSGYLAQRPESTSVQQLYQSLQSQHGSEATNKFFQNMGVPGLKYLDAGSRASGGQTRNYVMFPGNENMLSILERNGKPVK